MNEAVAVAKEADTKKESSRVKSDNSIHRVRDEPDRQLGSLRGVIGNITSNGGTPSVDGIATELGSMSSAQRAPVLLALQRTHGNQYVQRVVSGIQANLVVGQPGDIYEREADRVADAVMRMPEPGVQRQSEEEEEEDIIQAKPLAEQITPLVQRQVEEEEKEEEILQTKESSKQSPAVSSNLETNIQSLKTEGTHLPESIRAFFEPRFGHDFSKVKLHTNTRAAELARTEITPLMQRQESLGEVKDEELIQTTIARDVTPKVTPTISSGIQSLQGGGRPLSGSERSFFEPRFGADFSNVRVHNNTQAASVARSVYASAFTHGRNVVFGAGEYSQDTLAGRKLLAHELTHVVQQNGGPTLFSASKNFENTIPKAQKLSIVSPNFPVQRSLPYVLIGLSALGVVVLACAEPFVQISRRRYGNKSDKWRHCWVSCEISKTCGSAIAQLAGLTQEAQNLVHGQPLIGSLLDMLANNVCIPPETGIVTVLARLWRQSCEDCCNEAERQGVLPRLEQMEEEAEEEATLQTKPLVGHTQPLMQRQVGPPEQITSLGTQAIASPDLQHRITAIQGSGQPLSQAERNFFEPRFGVDFSQVRIHSDRWAAESAQMLNARAFTTGRDVVFATGQYAPWSNEGQRLLAHELTHVIQQRKASKNLVQAYRFDAYPLSAGTEFGGLGAYAERMEQEGRAIAFPVTDLSDLHTKMNEEKQRRISAGTQDDLVNELHLYGHGLPGQLQIGGVDYTHSDLRAFNETFEELMQPGAIIFAESCLSSQGEEGWELFRQLGQVFFGNRDGWLQGNTQVMQTIAGPIEARPRLFRYPHDFRGDFRARSSGDVGEVLRFMVADEEFLRNIDIDDSQLTNALIRGRRYSVNAVSGTVYRGGGQDFFAKFTIYPLEPSQSSGMTRRVRRYLHASGSAHWPYNESSGPSWTFSIEQNGEYILTLRIWTTQGPGPTNGDPSGIPESDRLTLRVIRRPLNVGYPRI